MNNKLNYNYKQVFLVLALVVLFISIIGCADKETADETEETTDDAETTEESTTEYDPEVVDTLTEDFDEMTW